jgi:PAS domain S-box-containing protein
MTTGLLAGSFLLLGISLWRLLQQRQDCFLKSKVIAATSCSVVVTDATVPRHPVIYVNPAFRLLTGYADEDVVGQSLALLNGSQTDRGVIEKIAVAIQDGRACRVLIRHYRKNGTPFWNEVTLSPVKNRAGLVTEYIWVMSDVTQRQQAEEALKDTHDPSRVLADLMTEGLIVTSEAKIAYANAGGLKLLAATSPEQAVGKPLQSFLDPDCSELVRRCIEQPQQAHPASRIAGRLLQLGGRAIEIHLSAAPILWQGKSSCLLLISQTTSRTVVDAEAKQAQAHLQSAQAMAHLGSWEWDIRAGTEIWSDEQSRIFGYEPGSIVPTYDTFTSALHPEDRDRVLSAIEQTLNSDSPYDVECRIIQPGGDVRFVRCRGLVTRNPEGQPLRMSGTVQDMTDYKLIEEVAKERDLQFKLVVEAAPSGMLMVRQDGTISLVNAQIEQMFGYSRDELLGRPVELLLPEHLRQRHAEQRVEFLSSPSLRPMGVGKDFLGRRKDGSKFPVDIGLNPLHLSSGISILATIIDITDRRRAEETLRESQERFELAVRAAHVGIFEHHHRTDSLHWSPTLRELYGIGAEEPVSLQRYIELLPREERDGILSALRKAHDPSGDGMFRAEHRIVKPGGDIRYVSVRAQTLFEGEDGARVPVRTIGTVVDITDRKNAEAHLRDASKIEAIGTLAGGIAHEFNNSLTAVLGFSELALPLVPADSKAHRHIQQVITAGRKSRELVHQLLTFSQQSDQVRRPLSLHSLVKEALKLLRPTIPSWIELRERIAGSTRPISADTTQMHQLILNLVENALHAMRKTGGVLELQLQDKEFAADQVTSSGRLAAGCYACLTVRDSGEGMEPEVASRIFDPFFTTKPLGEGRGMGLSVVHGIVTAHGGTVLVESQIGVGTTVSVYLPALPPRASSSPAKDEPLPRGHECILFVDDEESLARFGGEMLESLGYYPVVRMTATEAWQAFQVAPQRFDLLITDQTMPGMSGELLARECQRLRPDLPVILCTGSDQTLSADEARSHGVTEFVLKPLMLHDLAHTIRRVLDLPPQPSMPAPVPSSRRQELSTLLIEESDAVSTRR